MNFMPGDETGRVEGASGGNFARLAALEREWDPQNVFRFNQNIRPV